MVFPGATDTAAFESYVEQVLPANGKNDWLGMPCAMVANGLELSGVATMGKQLDRRNVLSGIIFVLKTGISWDDLPAELGWGCGRTCRETLAAWQQAGVWQQLHELLLAELNEVDRIDGSRVLIDSATVKAPKGGDQTGPNPTDRRKKRSKYHLVTDAKGVPLATKLTGANRQDVTQLIPLIDAIPAVRGRRGRPRRRPKRAQADLA